MSSQPLPGEALPTDDQERTAVLAHAPTETPAAMTSKKTILSAADKPTTVPFRRESIPSSLRDLKAWVGWRWERDSGRWTKVPVSPHALRTASVTNPATLATFEQAVARLDAGRVDGVGVALEPAGVLGVDLDDCRNPETGEFTPAAKEVIAAFDSYAEASPSGTGAKILVVAKSPGKLTRKGNVEMYDKGRYFTLTGNTVEGSRPEPEARQEVVDTFYRRLFPAKKKGAPLAVVPTTPVADNGMSDDELLAVAFAAKNGESLRKLWDGDLDGYKSESEAGLVVHCT